MIEVQGLSKRYGDKVAVDGLTFTVRLGIVTGFLGPNGAGKSTTMRMIVGLDRPTAGTVTVNGRAYREHEAPLAQVGSLLEAKAVHTGRTAYDHLLAMAATCGTAPSDTASASTRSIPDPSMCVAMAAPQNAGTVSPSGCRPPSSNRWRVGTDKTSGSEE